MFNSYVKLPESKHWLVLSSPLKNMWDDYFQLVGKNNKCSKPPTRTISWANLIVFSLPCLITLEYR